MHFLYNRMFSNEVFVTGRHENSKFQLFCEGPLCGKYESENYASKVTVHMSMNWWD